MNLQSSLRVRIPHRHPCGGRDPGNLIILIYWIPACARMTDVKITISLYSDRLGDRKTKRKNHIKTMQEGYLQKKLDRHQ